MPVGRGVRWGLVAWATALVAGFVFLSTLQADSRGYGTHQQLGFPPCVVRVSLGVPCPSCGGTTAFVHFVHGEFLQAARAHLGACGLALVMIAMIPWSLYSAATGRLWRVDRPELVLAWALGVFLAVTLLQWAAVVGAAAWI
jgi:hypothetical protein